MPSPFKRFTKDRKTGKRRFRGFYIWISDSSRHPSRKLVSLKTKDKKTADQKARSLLTQYDRGEWDPWEPSTSTGSKQQREIRTLSDAFEWIMGTRYAGARPNTVKIVRKSYTWFQRQVGNRDVASITPYHVQTFLSRYHASTKHRLHGTLRTFFGDLVQYEIIETSPMDKVPKPPAPPSRVRFLTDEEEVRLLHACNRAWIRNAIIIGLETGCRSNEIRHLRWEDCDFEQGLLHVRSHGSYRTKSGKDRVVPMTDRLRDHLKTIPRRGPYLVYLDERPEDPICDSTIIHRMRVTADRAGLHDVSIHVLRHSFASRAAQRGMPIFVLSRILGHSNLKTTSSTYAHLDTESVMHWMNKVMNHGSSNGQHPSTDEGSADSDDADPSP